jgi:hypothetical protein
MWQRKFDEDIWKINEDARSTQGQRRVEKVNGRHTRWMDGDSRDG